MEGRVPEQRHIIERRVTPDRRRGFERRIADRRVQIVSVERDRRGRHARRAGRERRSPIPRRSWIDRRGSGITWSGPPFPG